MKKIKIFIVGLFLFLVLFSLLDRSFFILITSPLRKEIQSKVDQLDIPKIKLIFDNELIEHFEKLYSAYTLEENHTQEYFNFLKFYKKNNVWKKANLIYNNESIRIKVKSHGKTPSNHKERDFISLSIKLEEGRLIRGANRFNLIVYWRVKEYDYSVYSLIAKDLGVFYEKTDLVSVEINDKPSKLYYFEYRLNREYLRHYKPDGLVSLKRNDNKSMLFFDDNIDSLTMEINNELQATKYNFLSSEEKTTIRNNFSILNEYLLKDNYDSINTFFEEDYIAKVLALKTISGSNDGFEKCNFIAPFCLSDSNFYPFVHRDCMFKTISNSDSIEFANEHFKLIKALNRNDSIRIKKYKILYDYISKTNIDSLALKIDSIQKFHESLYYSSSLKYHLGLNEEVPVVDNIIKLKDFIESSSPKIKFQNKELGFEIELQPNSFSPICFSSFKLSNWNSINEIQLTVHEKNTSTQIFKNSISINSSDITPLFNNLVFFSRVSDDMIKDNNVYKLDFKIKKNADLSDNPNNMDLIIKNKISNKEILSANYN